MFKTIKGGIQMIKLFNKVKEWFDGKKTYTALLGAAVGPATIVVKDFQAGMSVFQILGSQEWNALMLALGAIYIRLAIKKTDVKVDQAAAAATEQK